MNSTLEMIVRTGYRLFQEKGYKNVTANDICAACGITKTTFYYHLKSKADIFTLSMDAAAFDMQKILIRYYDSIDECNSYWERLIKFYDTVLLQAIMEGDADIFSQLLIVNLDSDKGYCDFSKTLATLGVWLLREAQNAGEIRNQSSPEELYKAIGFGNMGQELCWCIKKGDFDRFEQIHLFLEVICDVAPEYRVSQKTPGHAKELITWYRMNQEK